MTAKKTVLVGGATGRQGGAVVNRLLGNGHSVIAYVQNAQAPAAQDLQKRGVTLAVGDLNDPVALREAAEPADAIFSITIPFGPQGQAGEIDQGKNLANVADELQKHLIYSSIAGAKPTADLKVEHASSKQQIEAYLATKEGLRSTIIAPVYLMENLLNFKFNGLERGIYAQPLSSHAKINQVTVLDIASLAVWAIEHPATMVGKRIEVASDDISGEEIVQILSEVMGRPIKYYQTPLEQVRQTAGNEIATMYEKFEATPYKVDIAALRAAFPQIDWHTFKEWAETLDWKRLLPVHG